MKFLVALGLVVFVAGPALANECPTLQAQIDQTFGKRFDKTAASVKQLARVAWSLHKDGKHEEAVKTYDEAAKTGGMELKHMK